MSHKHTLYHVVTIVLYNTVVFYLKLCGFKHPVTITFLPPPRSVNPIKKNQLRPLQYTLAANGARWTAPELRMRREQTSLATRVQ